MHGNVHVCDRMVCIHVVGESKVGDGWVGKQRYCVLSAFCVCFHSFYSRITISFKNITFPSSLLPIPFSIVGAAAAAAAVSSVLYNVVEPNESDEDDDDNNNNNNDVDDDDDDGNERNGRGEEDTDRKHREKECVYSCTVHK